MKTSYLPDKKNSLGRKFFFLLLAGVFFFLIFIERGVLYDELVYYSLIVASPSWRLEDYLSERMFNFLVLFEDKKNLIRENEVLVKKVRESELRLSLEKMLRDENLVLKKMLGRVDFSDEFAGDTFSSDKKNMIVSNKENRIVSAVLSGQTVFPYNTIIIDVGDNLSVLPGDLVLVSPGIVLGEIIQTSKNISKVELLSSYGKKTGVFLGEEKAMVEVEGAGSGNFSIEVPKEFKVEKGGIVKYPGIRDLFVGVVAEINFDANSSYKEVLITVPLNLREVSLVEITSNHK